jgi:hypothetical protein
MTHKGLNEHVADRWVGYIRLSFPDGRTSIADALRAHDVAAMTRDPDDQHVCALALAAGARYLFTHDRGYLAGSLAAHGIRVLRPDAFLVTVFDDEPDAIIDVLRIQAHQWAGGRSVDELVDALSRANAPIFAAKNSEHLAARDS